MRWTDTGKAIRAVAKEKRGAELVGIDVGAHLRDDLRHRHRLPRDRRLPAAADLLRQSRRRQRLRAGRLHHRRARRHGLGAGALIGGLVIGVVESLGGLFLGESLGQIGIFVIFIAVLLFRPSGLFGATRMRGLAADRRRGRGCSPRCRCSSTPTSCSISWSWR